MRLQPVAVGATVRVLRGAAGLPARPAARPGGLARLRNTPGGGGGPGATAVVVVVPLAPPRPPAATVLLLALLVRLLRVLRPPPAVVVVGDTSEHGELVDDGTSNA